MKSKLSSLLSFACAAILLVGCGSKATVGSKCEALDAEAWNSSIWLSAVVARVGEVEPRPRCRWRKLVCVGGEERGQGDICQVDDNQSGCL